MSITDPRHGTINGYTTDRCRCDDCRSAATTYHRERRERIRLEAQQDNGPDGQPQYKHGTLGGYYGLMCRCTPCRTAAHPPRPPKPDIVARQIEAAEARIKNAYTRRIEREKEWARVGAAMRARDAELALPDDERLAIVKARLDKRKAELAAEKESRTVRARALARRNPPAEK